MLNQRIDSTSTHLATNNLIPFWPKSSGAGCTAIVIPIVASIAATNFSIRPVKAAGFLLLSFIFVSGFIADAQADIRGCGIVCHARRVLLPPKQFKSRAKAVEQAYARAHGYRLGSRCTCPSFATHVLEELPI